MSMCSFHRYTKDLSSQNVASTIKAYQQRIVTFKFSALHKHYNTVTKEYLQSINKSIGTKVIKQKGTVYTVGYGSTGKLPVSTFSG